MDALMQSLMGQAEMMDNSNHIEEVMGLKSRTGRMTPSLWPGTLNNV